jgi:hypothetical protein
VCFPRLSHRSHRYGPTAAFQLSYLYKTFNILNNNIFLVTKVTQDETIGIDNLNMDLIYVVLNKSVKVIKRNM